MRKRRSHPYCSRKHMSKIELQRRNKKTKTALTPQRFVNAVFMVGVKGFELPTSCSQTSLIVPCPFQNTTSCAFSVVYSALLSAVSVCFSSVCGRRCGQKSPLPKGAFRICRERIYYAYCSLDCRGCQVRDQLSRLYGKAIDRNDIDSVCSSVSGS